MLAILKRGGEPSDWHHAQETRKKRNEANFSQPTCNQWVTVTPSCSAAMGSAKASLSKGAMADGSPFTVDGSRSTA